jgi:hypothetical protein
MHPGSADRPDSPATLAMNPKIHSCATPEKESAQ